ncbi:hypothetical protein DIURU_000384 [Diutina rugosa]|uniref:Tag1-like fifth Ig-like domain-containing protein n=1 Tax=Diutina rugosa TaxID=5481 RepID=A0A642UZR6_DIURU|nr:uncharacterized protein DIURU_000384 [Diutina rugosa]KAA8907697.1 hypothetical protein DIURU_000384 [Diutina rugosa]
MALAGEDQSDYVAETTSSVSETTPLIAPAAPKGWWMGEEWSWTRGWRRHSRAQRHTRVVLLSVLAAIVLSGFALTVFIGLNLHSFVDESVIVTVHKVDIVGLHTNGFDVVVRANSTVDYSRVNSTVVSWALSLGAGIMGYVTAMPVDGVDLWAKPTVAEVESLALGTFYPETAMTVNITNHRASQLDVKGLVRLDVANLVRFLQYVNDVPDAVVEVDGRAVMDAQVKVGRFLPPVVVKGVEFSKHVWLEKTTLSQYTVKETDNGLEYYGEMNLGNSSISVNVPETDVYAWGCDDYHDLNATMAMSTIKDNTLRVSGVLGKIPDKFLKSCGHDLSPINRWAQIIMAQPWPLPQVLGVSINALDVIIDSSGPGITSHHNSSVSIYLASPHHVRIPSWRVTSFVSNVTAWNDDNAIIHGTTKGSEVLNTYYSPFSVEIDWHSTNHKSEVTNAKSAGKWANAWLHHDHKPLELAVDLKSVDIESSVLSTRLYDLQLKVPATIPPVVPSLKPNVSIDSVVCLESKQNRVKFTVTGTVICEGLVTVDASSESVTVALASNNETWGYATVPQLVVPGRGNQAPFSVDVTLNASTPESFAQLAAVMSQLISGDTDVAVDIVKMTSNPNPELSTLLGEMTIPKVPVPELHFVTGWQGEPASPFILESTVHIVQKKFTVTAFNPVVNLPLTVVVLRGTASYHGVILGHMEPYRVLAVTPGVWRSAPLPIVIEDVGMDILRRVLNGDLAVDIDAEIEVTMGSFTVPIHYQAQGIQSNIRW